MSKIGKMKHDQIEPNQARKQEECKKLVFYYTVLPICFYVMESIVFKDTQHAQLTDIALGSHTSVNKNSCTY